MRKIIVIIAIIACSFSVSASAGDLYGDDTNNSYPYDNSSSTYSESYSSHHSDYNGNSLDDDRYSSGSYQERISNYQQDRLGGDWNDGMSAQERDSVFRKGLYSN